MESAVRHLRDGVVKSSSGCPVLVVCDTLETVGGLDILKQLCDATLTAVEAKRAQATRCTLVLSGCRALGDLLLDHGEACTLLDALSDPCNWNRSYPEGRGDEEGAKKLGLLAAQGLDELYTSLAGESGSSAYSRHAASSDAPSSTATKCVIIDSLTPMLMHHHPQQVLALIDRLRMSSTVSCIVTSINEDLHDNNVLLGIEQLASCIVRLKPVSELHGEITFKQLGRKPHGSIDFRYKRRLGRVLAESYLYTLLHSVGAELYAPPPGMFAIAITPDRLVALGLISKQQQADAELRKSAASSAAAAAQEQLSSNMVASAATASSPAAPSTTPTPALAAPMVAGGMRLELTEAEKAARQQVVLPYEHYGQGKAYQTGDFRDYLPPSAGGYGLGGATGGGGPVAGTLAPVAGRSTAHAGVAAASGAGKAPQPLGHILYLRDSDEDHDSDEDPDDDLDI